MRSPAADRALRRLVARLATSAASDIELVLETLDPGQREEVRALLETYDAPAFNAPPRLAEQQAPRPAQPPGLAPAPPAAAAPDPAPDLSQLDGLSPWLRDRVLATRDTGGFAGRQVTPLARDALAQALAALPPETPLALPAAHRRRGPLAWMGRGA